MFFQIFQQTNPNIPISATNLPPELNPQSRTLDSSLENANSNSKPQQINKPAVMNPPTIEVSLLRFVLKIILQEFKLKLNILV